MENNPAVTFLDSEEMLFSLMGLYYEELFRYGIKFTGDVDATKDALNQFFIHFWDNRDKLGTVENVKAYLFVSYKRWLITMLRQKEKDRVVELSDAANIDLVEQPYEEYLIQQIRDQELRDIFKEAIIELPQRQRQLLQMRFYEHMDFDEIARHTSLSIRTIYNKLHEAIKRLREQARIKSLR